MDQVLYESAEDRARRAPRAVVRSGPRATLGVAQALTETRNADLRETQVLVIGHPCPSGILGVEHLQQDRGERGERGDELQAMDNAHALISIACPDACRRGIIYRRCPNARSAASGRLTPKPRGTWPFRGVFHLGIPAPAGYQNRIGGCPWVSGLSHNMLVRAPSPNTAYGVPSRPR